MHWRHWAQHRMTSLMGLISLIAGQNQHKYTKVEHWPFCSTRRRTLLRSSLAMPDTHTTNPLKTGHRYFSYAASVACWNLANTKLNKPYKNDTNNTHFIDLSLMEANFGHGTNRHTVPVINFPCWPHVQAPCNGCMAWIMITNESAIRCMLLQILQVHRPHINVFTQLTQAT